MTEAEREQALALASEINAPQTAPVQPALEVGTFAAALYQAQLDVAAVLGAPGAARPQAREPMFEQAVDLFDRVFAPTPWLVTGLITRGGTAVLGAEPKAGKTFIALDLAVAIATGTRALDEFQAQRGRVAYFFAEDLAVQVKNRVRALLEGRGLAREAIRDHLYVCPRGKFLDITRDEDLAWVIASCRWLGKLDLVVLDPLSDVHSGEEDKRDSMAPVMRRLRLLGELVGCTVLVAHHVVKASKDSSKRRSGQKLRGSSAIHGSIDSGIYVEKNDKESSPERFQLAFDVEIKGAKSAGRFNARLDLRDDANGEAVEARWGTSRSATSPTDDAAIKFAREEVAREAQASANDGKLMKVIREQFAAGLHLTKNKWRSREGTALSGLSKHDTDASFERLLLRGHVALRSKNEWGTKLAWPEVVPCDPPAN